MLPWTFFYPAALTQNRNRPDNLGRVPKTAPRIIYGHFEVPVGNLLSCNVQWTHLNLSRVVVALGRKFMRQKLLRFTLFFAEKKNIFSSWTRAKKLFHLHKQKRNSAKMFIIPLIKSFSSFTEHFFLGVFPTWKASINAEEKLLSDYKRNLSFQFSSSLVFFFLFSEIIASGWSCNLQCRREKKCRGKKEQKFSW